MTVAHIRRFRKARRSLSFQDMERTLALYPWTQGFRELIFWQPVWFLYFEGALTAERAILLMAIYDVVVVALEVPSGYLSDLIGRRVTLVLGSAAGAMGCAFLFLGGPFAVFLVGQSLQGLSKALQSGTDSALLYDTLAALGREDEVASQETRAFRFRFAALGVSAVSGGLLAQVSPSAVYLATAVALTLATLFTLLMREPPANSDAPSVQTPVAQLVTVLGRLRDPVLLWVFVGAVATYTMSHVPFVFGQPYVERALATIGAEAGTPMAMGVLIAGMMILSLVASLIAPWLRRVAGLAGCFLVGLLLQVGLIGAMAVAVHPGIALLMILRMVPNAFIQPYQMEAIQPRLQSGYRATYLSVQNQMAALVFSVTLFASAWGIGAADAMTDGELRGVLLAYFAAGVVVCATLLLTRRAVRANPEKTESF